MEKYPKTLKDKDLKMFAEHVRFNAMGLPIELESEPTSASEMKGSTWGFYDGELFIKDKKGNLYKWTLTAV